MTSVARTTDRARRGFTLIEMVMVLALAAVIMGGAAGYMVFTSSERVLRDAAGRVEDLAKRARTIAILNQTPYALEFRQGMVRLLPLANAGVVVKRGHELPPTGSEGDGREVLLNSEINLSIQRWNSPNWLGISQDAVEVWRFDPDGLCEPISVRMGLGDSFILNTFHPLTATVSYSELEAR